MTQWLLVQLPGEEWPGADTTSPETRTCTAQQRQQMGWAVQRIYSPVLGVVLPKELDTPRYSSGDTELAVLFTVQVYLVEDFDFHTIILA